jgi:uroporphyrinogen decarboxylase
MFRNLEQVLTDPITDEVFYREMMEFFLERLILRARKLVEAGADVIEIGAHYANSDVGPKFYRSYVLEYEQRLCRALRDAGALVILHNCGRAKTVMQLYNELPINCWGYLTPPPFGDVDLDEALRVMRPDLALRGNVDQVQFLVKATPDEVKERVKQVVVKAKQRGNFILSTTDFFFDGTPYENIRAFADTGREYGSYD